MWVCLHVLLHRRSFSSGGGARVIVAHATS
jgi:hypothetical protein